MAFAWKKSQRAVIRKPEGDHSPSMRCKYHWVLSDTVLVWCREDRNRRSALRYQTDGHHPIACISGRTQGI